MWLLNSFFVYLFICNFECYVATAASVTPEKQRRQPADLSTPGTVATNSVAPPFATPQRQIIGDAAVVSPPRADKKPWGTPSLLSTGSSLDIYDAGVQEIIKKLLDAQRRPFILIREAPSVAEVEAAAVSTQAVGAGRVKYVIIAPTHESDFEPLKSINQRYQTLARDNSFLERDYGEAASFSEKIAKLREHYNESFLLPILYQMIPGFYESAKSKNQHFGSSVTFTIIGIKVVSGGAYEKVILGDIWLSHIDSESEEVCIRGTAERSTMVDAAYQSMGIGQAAVGMFNEVLVKNWVGKPVKLLDSTTGDAIATKTNIIFDGIMSYVEPNNYKSIGYNYRIGNFPVGLTTEYIMFRKQSGICSPKHLAIDALERSKQNPNLLPILLALWQHVKYLYPSRKAVEDGVWHKGSDGLFYPAQSANVDYASSLGSMLLLAKEGGYVSMYSASNIEQEPSFSALQQSLLGPATMPRPVTAVADGVEDARLQDKELLDQMARTATDGTEDMDDDGAEDTVVVHQQGGHPVAPLDFGRK